MIWRVKEVLEAHGVPCFIRNEFASGGIGELSPFDAQPEVWLMDEEWKARAEKLIEPLLDAQPDSEQPWTCDKCQETNEASFETCWQCGEELPVD